MKRILVYLLMVISLTVQAESTIQADRRELQELLNERKLKFDSFAVAAEKHSGFFVNKTKGDMKRSNEVLIEIVRTDNKIIRSLNRVVDFRNYEKVTMNYDLRDREQVLKNLETAVDTLSKSNDTLALRNSQLEHKIVRKNLALFLLVCASVFLFIRNRRKSSTNY